MQSGWFIGEARKFPAAIGITTGLTRVGGAHFSVPANAGLASMQRPAIAAQSERLRADGIKSCLSSFGDFARDGLPIR